MRVATWRGIAVKTLQRRARQISQSDCPLFLTRPISCTLLALSVLLVVVPAFLRWRKAHRLGVPA